MWRCVVLVFSSLVVSALCGTTYFITAPNIFHLGQQEAVWINVYGNTRNVAVNVMIKDYPLKTRIISQQQVVVNRNQQAVKVALRVPAAHAPDVDVNGRRYVYLSVEADGGAFRKETPVLVSLRNGYVFIQTDKPIYTPRHSVTIRVFSLDEDMKPMDQPIRLDIVSPQGIVVQRETLRPTNPGIVESSFYFYYMARTGNWKVVASYGHEWKLNETVEFEVREYVLPRFNVKIKHNPGYILPSDRRISGIIEVKYSYGEDVNGNVTVEFHVEQPGDGRTTKIFRQELEISYGSAIYHISPDILRDKQFWFPGIAGSNLLIRAVATENATATREESLLSIPFVLAPYRVSFRRSVRYFKPGIPYELRVDVTKADGRPAIDTPVKIDANGTQDRKKWVSLSGRNGAPLETSTNQDGRVKFTLDTAPNLKLIQIRLDTNVPGGDQQGSGLIEVLPFDSPSSSFVLVYPKTPEPIPVSNAQMEVQAFFTKHADVTHINHLVLVRGELVHFQTETRQVGVVSTSQIPVTPKMSPEARLLTFYVRNKGSPSEIVADSILLDVEEKCQNEVRIRNQEPRERTYKPGSPLVVDITAEPNSQVAFMMVDKAVYFLNEENILNSRKMFGSMHLHDLGCGPGSGSNSADVFANAGLTVLTNAALTVNKRDDEACPEDNVERNDRKKRSTGGALFTNTTVCCEMGQESDPSLSCSRKAASLINNSTKECINVYFNCCKIAEQIRVNHVSVESFGRMGKSNAQLNVEEDLFEIGDLERALNVRREFPESSHLTIMNITDGILSYDITLPDSITTWVMHGVGMSRSKGMCVAQPYNVTTLKKRFIELHLPYSVIKGEQIEVKVTVFNYDDSDFRALVFMEGTDKICSGVNPGENSEQRRVTVRRSRTASVSWPVIPLAVGEFRIKVKAFFSIGADAVEKVLHVLPGGLEQYDTHSIILDPKGLLSGRTNEHVQYKGPMKVETFPAEQRQIVTMNLTLPADTVLGSGKCFVNIMGELLGNVVESVVTGSVGLLRAARGCGEQTVIYLGPTLYASRYLKETGQMTADMELEAYKHIRQGVARELTFRHKDGSYAAWLHRPSSSWLTAYVIKVFAQAQHFDNVFQDDPDDIICSGIRWLVGKQKGTGEFYEPHAVVHREMMGGTSTSGVTMTAFVYIAIKEADCPMQESQNAMQKALRYLEPKIDSLTRPYDAAIVAYALALANSPQKIRANDKLRSLARYDAGSNTRFWPTAVGGKIRSLEHGWTHVNRAPAMEVETASYAILAQLTLNEVTYCHAIVNWLTTRRNGKGGFISTQDTVLALQALSEYRIVTRRAEIDLRSHITSDKDNQLSEYITVNPDNALVMQRVDVSNYLGYELVIDTRAQGQGGTAELQVEMIYNLRPEEGSLHGCVFDMNVTSKEFIPPWPGAEENEDVLIDIDQAPDPNRRRRNVNNMRANIGQGASRRGQVGYVTKIEVCARYLRPEGTDMAIIEVAMFTGFEPVKKDLDDLKANNEFVENYEVQERHVTIYMERIPSDRSTCIHFKAKRTSIVGNVQPVPVRVFDYYEPGESCVKFYHPEDHSSLLGTLCEGEQCVCTETKCGTCYGVQGGYYEEPMSLEDLTQFACYGQTDYVMTVKVTRKTRTSRFEQVTVEVENAIKEGGDANLPRGSSTVFHRQLSCRCPELEVGKTYLIIGKDVPYTAANGQQRFKYLLNVNTYVTEFLTLRQHPRGTKWYDKVKQMRRFATILKRQGCPN